MEITGRIIFISPVISGISQRTGNPWASLEFVIETDDQYPQKVCLKLFGQERIDKFTSQVGDSVTAHFDCNATEYNGRWYNQLNAFSVAPAGQTAAPQQAAQQQPQQQVVYQNQPSYPPQGYAQQPQQPQVQAPASTAPGSDDLPF